MENLLTSLKTLHTIGIQSPSCNLIMTILQITPKIFKRYMMSAKSGGLVVFLDSRTIAITPAGIAAVPGGILGDVPTTNEQLQGRIKEICMLEGLQGWIFDVLATDGGTPRTMQQIATHLGCLDRRSRFRFQRSFQDLTYMGIAEKNEEGKYQLSRMCYLRQN